MNSAPPLQERIARQTKSLRESAGLSLDALAQKSGVSRSMLSLIERGESSPTAVVLEKLAAGLGAPLARLFDFETDATAAPSPVARRSDQPTWRDPGSGYERRNVSPTGAVAQAQIVDVHFPPGARIAFETAHREAPMHQQIWILAGAMEITVGNATHLLRTGDCFAMTLDQPTAFHNPHRQAARYAVVLVPQRPPRR